MDQLANVLLTRVMWVKPGLFAQSTNHFLYKRLSLLKLQTM